MAETKEDARGSSNWVFWTLFLVPVAIAAGASYLYRESERARTALEDSKRDYEEMRGLKRTLAEGKARTRRVPVPKETTEDPITFLGRKATQAGIPQSIFRPAKNLPVKLGAWTETSYTVTMQGTKDAPVSRSSVADFIVSVETERPAIRSKNLSLTYVPSSGDFGSVTVVFAQYQRE